MSADSSGERESAHPLFHVLVLMGGSLALGCGGSAVMDGSVEAGGAQANGGASSGGAQGGAAPARGGSSAGGTAPARGGSSAGGAPAGGSAGAPDCPPAQWNCSGFSPTCSVYLGGFARPAGCVCDPSRPRSVADCGPKEDLVCLAGYGDQAYSDPQSWDGTRHVQCTCAPSSPDCQNECATAYPELNPGSPISVFCTVPSVTCDPSGNNCTATSSDVLRQDGIVCGCASIILK